MQPATPSMPLFSATFRYYLIIFDVVLLLKFFVSVHMVKKMVY